MQAEAVSMGMEAVNDAFTEAQSHPAAGHIGRIFYGQE